MFNQYWAVINRDAVCRVLVYMQKKDVRLIALRPQNRGIAKRLIRMNIEETIFPRRKIYVGSVQKAHYRHIHRMSIDCFGPLMKILAKFLFLDFNKML